MSLSQLMKFPRDLEPFVGTELWFDDAVGVPFHINREHGVAEVDRNPRRHSQ